MDNNTARIEAQELQHEHSKNCATGTSVQNEPLSQKSSVPTPVEHTDKAIKDETTELDKTQSEPTPEAVKVPHAERRGLFGRFTLVAEVTEPKHYPRSTKWFLTFVVALAAVAAPLGSTIIFPSLLDISHDLKVSPTVTNLSASVYMLAMAIFPLWWSSFSETLGRRSIYLVSFTLFLIWNILAAVSVNIAMLVVMRTLAGGAAASVQAVGAGTIADLWDTLKASPPTEPVTNSPPTEPSSLSRTTSVRSVAQKSSRYIRLLRRFFIDPLAIVLYLRFPAVLITVYYAAITFGSLYLLNISLETTFSAAPYNFKSIIVGLTYIPAAIGYILASIFGGRWTDHIMAREARRAGRYDEKGKLLYRPEDRMKENAWIAAILYPGALIWYGWTVQKGVHWIVPLVANFFFGVGSMLVFAMATTMLTEFMPKKASAGVAVNNLIRNIFSCIGSVVAQPLIDAIGNGWLFTGVGVIAASSSVVVWAMSRFGPRWRERMNHELG
ncbi:uncharacterized protein KY384_006103 [Bacidia gigantensis]|uniref:uncharacterized protein n=1 Tax=Bacidia gigantensis TaxID=2732470 RepID=UPI001D03F273|nr:uncharacterized protein KY384_006103 [Bacidia gigantensis]KAG8529466.1 hypothetical protein KY384_006103 [Bacidia gigantensis]